MTRFVCTACGVINYSSSDSYDFAARSDRMESALHRILEWADAYPLTVFPALDDDYLRRAHEVLRQHGMTIDRISASAMRHVITQVKKICQDALQ